ncbi:calmodulin-related protein [Artemisia annua]|uniref:Calmodulin-related protein n=1 Tax=Artemisia annua TaxID=35608 RepID=A0A2U1PMN4_ARTAN|nr:calmodulin-related protein [Artemisia annua]
MASTPVSKDKGKKKVGLKDDEEYQPSASFDGVANDKSGNPKPKKSTPSKKTSKLSDNSGYIDDDEALMKAIALSLQDSPGFLDVTNKTPPQSSGSNASSAETTERKQSVQKDDSGKRKRKNMVTSRVQMSEDELILQFFQFDAKPQVERCNLRQGSDNAEQTAVAS